MGFKFSKDSITPILAVELVFLFMGLIIFKDYGISWDEQRERKTAAIAAIYINAQTNYFLVSEEKVRSVVENAVQNSISISGDRTDYSDPKEYHTYVDRDYGVFFGLILAGLEFGLKLEDSRDVYLMRHLMTHLLFLVAVLAFMLTLQQVFKDWRVAVLGGIMLILTPRIYGHSFFNIKDLPFMSFCAISIYSLILYTEKKTIKYAILHALACAIAIDTRIPGLIFPLISIVYIATFCIIGGGKKDIRNWLISLGLYMIFLALFVFLFWPYLWESPIENFLTSFSNMSKFRWNQLVLFQGELMHAEELPWYYPFTWIINTTPILYLLGFSIVLIFLIRELFEKDFIKSLKDNKFYFLSGMAFLAPLTSIIIFDSVLYNGWRQVYFVYPGLLFLCIGGFVKVYELIKVKRKYLLIFLVIILLSLSHILIRSIWLHPYQQTYFNILAGSKVEETFPIDYWGTSYLELLEELLKVDKREKINVFAAIDNTPLRTSSLLLDEKGRKKINYVTELSNADYLLTTYSKIKDRDGYLESLDIRDDQVLFTLNRDGNEIASIIEL